MTGERVYRLPIPFGHFEIIGPDIDGLEFLVRIPERGVTPILGGVAVAHLLDVIDFQIVGSLGGPRMSLKKWNDVMSGLFQAYERMAGRSPT